jgi:hypothetical protein
MGLWSINTAVRKYSFLILFSYPESIVEFGVCMSLLTLPIGLDEVSVIQSIGDYVSTKLPERWLAQEHASQSKDREDGAKDFNSILFRWR